jgi:hypothetical protein
VELSEFTQVICLLPSYIDIESNGTLIDFSSSRRTLETVKMKSISFLDCFYEGKKMWSVISPYSVCATYVNERATSCVDSGKGFYVYDEHFDRFVLGGVVSLSVDRGCGGSSPLVLLAIEPFKEWIEEGESTDCPVLYCAKTLTNSRNFTMQRQFRL